MSSEFLNWLSVQSKRITPEECAKLREAAARLKELEDAPVEVATPDHEFGKSQPMIVCPDGIACGDRVALVRIPK